MVTPSPPSTHTLKFADTVHMDSDLSVSLEVEDDFITIKPPFKDLWIAVCKNMIQSCSAAH